MWILSEVGYIHSGRIVAIRPPDNKDDLTLRVSLTGEERNDIRIMRDDAEKFIGRDIVSADRVPSFVDAFHHDKNTKAKQKQKEINEAILSATP